MRHDELTVIAKMLLVRHKAADFTPISERSELVLVIARYTRASALILLGIVTDDWSQVQEAIGTITCVSGCHDWKWALKVQERIFAQRNLSSFCECRRCEEDESEALEFKSQASRREVD